jgi:NTP pyrophosphatase (non-canonical NTP hydrolase)
MTQAVKTFAESVGADMSDRAQQYLAKRAERYGDPTTELFNKTRIAKVVLDASGVTQGEAFTPRVNAAMELGKLAVGLVRAPDAKEVLADAIATIVCLAQVEAVEGQLRAERVAAAQSKNGNGNGNSRGNSTRKNGPAAQPQPETPTPPNPPVTVDMNALAKQLDEPASGQTHADPAAFVPTQSNQTSGG